MRQGGGGETPCGFSSISGVEAAEDQLGIAARVSAYVVGDLEIFERPARERRAQDDHRPLRRQRQIAGLNDTVYGKCEETRVAFLVDGAKSHPPTENVLDDIARMGSNVVDELRKLLCENDSERPIP